MGLQLVGIGVPLPVEIAQNKPIGVEQLFGARQAESAQQVLFKLEVGQAILLAGADVVKASPKFIRQLIIAHIRKQPAGILHSRPLEHTVDGNMKHNRVHIL